MSKPPPMAAETAAADQLSAAANDEVASLAKVIRMGDARDGEAQNLANFIADLAHKHPPQFLAALFVAAVRQIPDGDPS